MSKKLYLCEKDGQYFTVKANHKPLYSVGIAPDARVEVLDIIDDIDPETQEVIGKKAVVNAQKLAKYNQAKADAQAARDAAAQAKQAAIAQLKANGSDDVKQLINILGL